MISSNTVERQIREDFVLRCNISSERGRADAICASSEQLSPDCVVPVFLFMYYFGRSDMSFASVLLHIRSKKRPPRRCNKKATRNERTRRYQKQTTRSEL